MEQSPAGQQNNTVLPIPLKIKVNSLVEFSGVFFFCDGSTYLVLPLVLDIK